MADEQVPSCADYHHGAEMVAEVFSENLIRQLVEVKFERSQVFLCIGKTVISMLIDTNLTSQNCLKMAETGGRVVAQVVNVQCPK